MSSRSRARKPKSLKALASWIKAHRPVAAVVAAIPAAGLAIAGWTALENHKTLVAKNRAEIAQELDQASDLLGTQVMELQVVMHEHPENVVKAERLIRDAIGREPRNERALFAQGMLGIATRNVTQAADAFDKLVKIAPSKPDGYTGLGLVAEAFGVKDAAVVMYREALRRDPDSAQLKFNLASALLATGKQTDGVSMLEQVAATQPSCALLVELGVAHAAAGDLTRGIKDTARATDLCPHDDYALMNYGHLLYRAGRLNEALEQYTEASKVDPQYDGSLVSMAGVQIQLMDYRAANESIDKALGRDSHNALAHLQRGWLLVQEKRYAEGLESYERAIRDGQEHFQETQPNALVVDLYMSQAYACLARFDDALNYANQALAIDPQNRDALTAKTTALQGIEARKKR